MVIVDPTRIVLDLPGHHFLQQIRDLLVIGHRHLNAHGIETVDRGRAHAAADEELAIANVIELGHVRRVAPHAVMVIVIMVMIVVVMVVITCVRQFT